MSSNETDFASSRELKPEELENVSGGWIASVHDSVSTDLAPPKNCEVIDGRPGSYIWFCPRS